MVKPDLPETYQPIQETGEGAYIPPKRPLWEKLISNWEPILYLIGYAGLGIGFNMFLAHSSENTFYKKNPEIAEIGLKVAFISVAELVSTYAVSKLVSGVRSRYVEISRRIHGQRGYLDF